MCVCVCAYVYIIIIIQNETINVRVGMNWKKWKKETWEGMEEGKRGGKCYNYISIKKKHQLPL